MKKLKVYFLPYGDGENDFAVAAENMKNACSLLRCSVGYFKRYGGRSLTDTPRDREVMELATAKPGKVLKRPGRNYTNEPKPWTEELP